MYEGLERDLTLHRKVPACHKCTEMRLVPWGWSLVWFSVETQDNMPKLPCTQIPQHRYFPTTTLTMGCFDSNTTFRYTLWYGMSTQSFPKIHNFLHLSKTSASNTQDVKPCFYMISWHVEEWSTGVWGKWFTDTGLSRGLICHASHSQALFPSSLSLSQRQHAAHRWQWKGLPSHSSN